MTTGRKLRLGAVAAILAALFVLVTVSHAGSHLDSAMSDPPCATCGVPVLVQAADPLPAPEPARSEERIPSGLGVLVAVPGSCNSSRGPPAGG